MPNGATIQKHEMLANDLLLSRLYADVNTLDTESCWLWKKSVIKDGYGLLRRKINGKAFNIFVHRLSWITQYGEIPDGMVVDHTCHNPADCSGGVTCQHRRCINPSHLALTTTKQNLAKGSGFRSNVGLCKNNLHKWTEANIKTWKNSGKTVCIPCVNAQAKRGKERRANA